MDYEKKYKEALKRAEKALEVLGTDKCEGARQIFSLFLELKESEDERIRKGLVKAVSGTFEGTKLFDTDVTREEALAWLEKQEGCEYIKKDWLEHIKQSWYKEGFIDGKYTPKEWTINDATTLNELIDFLENGTVKLQHDLTLYANWLKTQFSPIEKQGEQKPSDEDMKESLRTEYEKDRADAFAEMQKEWSEDDEKRLQSCINILKAKSLMGKVDTVNTMWLKSLKQRIGGKL